MTTDLSIKPTHKAILSYDKRSDIVNDPNNPDDPEYIVKLIGKVVTVSIETVDIIKKLPGSEP
jgi:predicted helicase